MPRRKDTTPKTGYFQQTRQPWHCLLLITLPLLFFHIGAAIRGSDLVVPYLFQVVLGYFGAPALHMSGLFIVVTLLVHHWKTHDPWRVEPAILLGMLLESILWTLPLIALTYVTPPTAAAVEATTLPVPNVMEGIIRAIGAGVYEEFFFRLVLISVIMLIFVDVFELPKATVLATAVVVTAVVFSLWHRPWAEFTGEVPFEWSKFIFHTCAGLLWGCVYVFRGLGIAVWSHVLYDLYYLYYLCVTAVTWNWR